MYLTDFVSHSGKGKGKGKSSAVFEVTTRSQLEEQHLPDEDRPKENRAKSANLGDSGIGNATSDCPLTLAINESRRLVKCYEDDLQDLRQPVYPIT